MSKPLLSDYDVWNILKLLVDEGMHPADVALGYPVSAGYIAQLGVGRYRVIPGYQYPTVLPYTTTPEARALQQELRELAEKYDMPVIHLQGHVFAAQKK